jgi:osmotically inducible protein OsmC
MPHIERTAHVAWDGNVARGSGSITADSGAFAELGFSLPTRIGRADGKTSPEELLAAAHGGCITMSLASELSSAGMPPGHLTVTCRIVMDDVEGQGHQIVQSHVDAIASVEGLDESGLQTALVKADEGCPFSALLRRAGVELHVSARLA